MESQIVNHKSLRRSHFPSRAEYDVFLNHFIKPLVDNAEQLNEYFFKLCREEECLKDALILTDLGKFKKQILRHMIWKQIYDSYLPMTHPHEFTIFLVNQLILDYSQTNRNALELNALQNQHLIIIIRFINGLLDYYQKSKYALSLVKLAEKLGIPSWIVDLRHMATHERELPNIKFLRKGIVWCLTHLVKSYWMSQEEGDSDFEEGENEENESIVSWGEKRKHSSNSETEKIIEVWDATWSSFANKKWSGKEATAFYEKCKTFHNFKSQFVASDKNSKKNEFVLLLQAFKNLWKQLRDQGKEELIIHILQTPINGIKNTMIRIFIARFHRFDLLIVQLAERQNVAHEIYPLVDFNVFCKQHKAIVSELSIPVLKQMVKVLKAEARYTATLAMVKNVYKRKVKCAGLSKNGLSNNLNQRTPELGFQREKDSGTSYIFELQENWEPKPFGML